MDDQSTASVTPQPTNVSAQQVPGDMAVGVGSKEFDTRESLAQTYATEKEPVITNELKEHGVEVSKNPKVPVLTVQDKSAGIAHSPSSDHPVPPPFSLTEQQAQYVEKTASKESSLFWFAGLVVKHFKKIHGRLIKNES